MTTQQEYAQRAQYMKNMGFPEAEIQRRLQLQMSAEQAQAAQVEAQQREATNPPPSHDWSRYDMIDRRNMAMLDRTLDPLRAAQEQAEEQRDQAELAAIDAQLRPLQEQRAVVATRIQRRRFQG
jgi:hypothetical protein